jgi:NAD dependent epimerase/dehydratase
MLDLKGKKVLVTGGSGFIGSHLVELLHRRGCRVRVLVFYETGPNLGCLNYLPPDVLSQIEIFNGDIKNPDDVKLAAEDVQVIFHLAALVGIPYSYVHPRHVVETNTVGTLNVLMAGKELPVEKIVHTSTSEAYGTAKYAPIDEEHPLQGQSPYAASKISADKLAESFHRSFGLPVATVRPFNQYGPRQSARAVIPTIISQCLTGDEVHLGSLHPLRDFVFVKDTIEGYVKIAESEASVGEVINIGSGREISIGDLTQKIIGIVGRDIKVICKDERVRPEKSEVGRLLCNNAKAERLVGWKPRTTLDQGLAETIAWIEKNLAAYDPRTYAV